MTSQPPDGAPVANPSTQLLKSIIYRTRDRYWDVGSGSGDLSVVELKKNSVTPIYSEPALVFFLVERHGFFFDYVEANKFREQFVPFTGGASRPWVAHTDGQMEMYVPRACFISRDVAGEILAEFLRSGA